MPQDKRLTGFNIFEYQEQVKISRIGNRVTVSSVKDNSFTDSNSVEANLLYEILKALKKK